MAVDNLSIEPHAHIPNRSPVADRGAPSVHRRAEADQGDDRRPGQVHRHAERQGKGVTDMTSSLFYLISPFWRIDKMAAAGPQPVRQMQSMQTSYVTDPLGQEHHGGLPLAEPPPR